MADTQLSQYGKTCPEPLAATRVMILGQCLKKSQRPKYQYLSLDDGQQPEWLEGTGAVLPGECLTLSIGECPNVVRGSSLSQILQENVPEKYFLSQKACLGILRRAEKRGKKLPPVLEMALREQAGLIANLTESQEPSVVNGQREQEDPQGMSTIILSASQSLSGCAKDAPGGGKGPLISENKSLTLATGNDQVIFEPIQLYDMTHAEEVMRPCEPGLSPTLNARMGTGGNQMPVLMEPTYCLQGSMIGREDKNGPQGDGINEDICFTLNTTDRHAVLEPLEIIEFHCRCGATSIINSLKEPCLGCGDHRSGEATYLEPIPINDKATRYKGGGDTRNGDGAGNGLGVGKPGDPMPTLTAGDRHAVAHCDPVFALDRAAFNQGANALYEFQIESEGITQTVIARGPNAVAVPPRYRVRRLTPTECLRLMHFPDDWLDLPGASDSAKYKAVGNSIEGNCARFIMGRLVEVAG